MRHCSSEHLQGLPQVGTGAQQGSLPSAPHARGFCKAAGAHLSGPHTPIGQNRERRTPSVSLLIYLKQILIYSCTSILGTFFEVYNKDFFKNNNTKIL